MFRTLTTAFALSLGLATAAMAQNFKVDFGISSSDPNAPVEVAADSLSVDQDTGSATFAGNVKISQGNMTMTAPRVNVFYNEDQSGIARLVGSGGVSISSGKDSAQAQNADYNVDTQIINMTGSVQLVQGFNSMSAERMSVNVSSGTAELHGRVRTVLNPKAN